jgi:Flp pilus assembly protein protease CpaA
MCWHALDLLILIGSIFISIIDIREHRIYNAHLLLFGVLLSFNPAPIAILEALILIAVTLALSILFNIGGGDFKLFSLLVALQGENVLTSQYLVFVSAALTLTLLSTAMIKGTLATSAPLAPAILAPFVAIYLGI